MIDPADHLGLVRCIVRDMVRPGAAHLLDDLLQEGMVGLVEAARRYDPELGVKFSSFAAHHIRGHVLAAVRDQLGAVKLPKYHWEHGRRPSAPVPFDAPSPTSSDENTSPRERLADESPTPAEVIEGVDLERRTRAVIIGLSPRLRDVMLARLDEGLTLEEIGRRRGISKQAVQQLERRAIAILRVELSKGPR